MKVDAQPPTPIATPQAHDPKLVQAAQGFEAFFLNQLMKEMQPKSEGFDQGVYQGMMTDKLSTEMAKTSPLGLAPMLLEAFEKHQPSRQHEAFKGFTMTSAYGVRPDPFTQVEKFHHGWDLAAPEGTPVGAQAPGTVAFSGEREGYGNVVEVAHKDGSVTIYGHLKTRRVSTGDGVQAHDIIGEVGSSGRSTGPHLHFEVRTQGRSVNPADWLSNFADPGVKRPDLTRNLTPRQ